MDPASQGAFSTPICFLSIEEVNSLTEDADASSEKTD